MRLPRTVRSGFSLLELVFAALILGGATVVFMNLVEASSRRVYRTNLDQMAYQFNASLVARFGSVRPNDLARIFASRERSVETLSRDPIVRAARNGPAGLSGFGPLAPTLVYRNVPGQSGVGRLEASARYSDGSRERVATTEALVHGRRLPSLPPLSAELATRRSDGEQAVARLVTKLEASPRDARAQVLLPLIRMEARHGAVARPYERMIAGAQTQVEVLEALVRAFAGQTVPDGSYRADWTTIGPITVVEGGRVERRTVTFFKILDGSAQGRILVLVEVEKGEDSRLTIEGAEGIDLGEIALEAGHGPGGIVQASSELKARVRATGRRVYAIAPRLSAGGRPQTVASELTIVSFPGTPESGRRGLDPASVKEHTARALTLAGLAPAR